LEDCPIGRSSHLLILLSRFPAFPGQSPFRKHLSVRVRPEVIEEHLLMSSSCAPTDAGKWIDFSLCIRFFAKELPLGVA